MKKLLLILGLIVLSTTFATAQGVAINSDGSLADASASLDITSTTTGILIPRMTKSERIAISTPVQGLLVYQIDGKSKDDEGAGFYYWETETSEGAIWVKLLSKQAIVQIVGSSLYVGLADFTTATGEGNLSVGENALNGLTTGINNTVLGSNAGTTLTGSSNILIGQGVDPSAVSATNELNIGDAVYGTGIHTSNSKIGIGNSNVAPNSTLDVGGSLSLPILMTNRDTALSDEHFTIVIVGNSPIITLPDPTNIVGRIYVIKILSGATPTLYPLGVGSTIDGVAGSWSLAVGYLRVQAASANQWIIIGSN